MLNVKNSQITWGKAIYYQHSKGDFVLPHSHKYYELVLYKNGTGRTNYGVVEYNYRSTTLLIIPPETSHSENTLTPTEVTCLQISLPETMRFPLSIIYSSEKNNELFSQIETLLKTLSLKWFRLYPHEELDISTFNAYMDKANTSGSDLLLELLLLINKLALDKNLYQYSQNQISFSIAYIERNFNKQINYPALAEQLGYSYSRFRFLFKKATSQTLKQYQLGIQFSKAKQYLVETKLTVKEIAKKCGFSSDIRFISDFKEKFNITPLQYRNLIAVNFGNTSGVANLNQNSTKK